MTDKGYEWVSRLFDDCRASGQPFILSADGKLRAVAMPPLFELRIVDPPIELTPDVLRALLLGAAHDGLDGDGPGRETGGAGGTDRVDARKAPRAGQRP
jgi:hypothetical protein